MRILRKVINGAGRGKTLGFPTANLRYYKTDKIKFGVWVVRVKLLDSSLAARRSKNITEAQTCLGRSPRESKVMTGLAIVGPARTFNETKPKIEVHIFNFHGNLYNKKIRVEFLKYLRPIRKFRNKKSLVAQIKKDRLMALKIKN